MSTEPPPTLNDPPWGPTPLTPRERAILELYRRHGCLPATGGNRERRLTGLGYLREIPEGPTSGWLEITPNGILALTPLE
jgi:hypothetical protein